LSPLPTASSSRERPSSWWLDVLRRRAERTHETPRALSEPFTFASDEAQTAAVRFFNAAYRAEESGLRQAHELAGEVETWDPTLAEVLRLYGDEEGWHRELLTVFLETIGGEVREMGRVTRLLYGLYGRARNMETIVLTNLMFETIGSTTYRLALGRVSEPAVHEMLRILTRDEAFHVPLNAHFLRRVLERVPASRTRRLRRLFPIVFISLVALPLASRPKAKAFDRIGTLELSRAYAAELSRVFDADPTLPLASPGWLLGLLGVARAAPGSGTTSVDAAESAQDRDAVRVAAL
jgi:hypothetical protein